VKKQPRQPLTAPEVTRITAPDPVEIMRLLRQHPQGPLRQPEPPGLIAYALLGAQIVRPGA